jgi:hypothetical protein
MRGGCERPGCGEMTTMAWRRAHSTLRWSRCCQRLCRRSVHRTRRHRSTGDADGVEATPGQERNANQIAERVGTPENIGLHPVAIALENRVPLAEKLRKVAPGAARAGNPKRGLRQIADCRSRPVRDRLVLPSNAAPSSPTGRRSSRNRSISSLKSRQTRNGNLFSTDPSTTLTE